MTITNPARKYAIAVECLIDFEEAQSILKERFYGSAADDVPDIPWSRFSRTAFSQLAPRKGMLGFVHDMREENGQFAFFTNTQDRIQGEKAEEWIRDWLADPFINLAQTNNPHNLDAQVFIVPKNSSYQLLAGHPRTIELDLEGEFNVADHAWAIDLDSSGADAPTINPPADAPDHEVEDDLQDGEAAEDDDADDE